MCGIAGIVDLNGLPPLEVLEHARDTLAHRGPDDAGVFVNERRDAALLFRRLSIIDLSAAGHQPLKNEDGSRWIVFNGEVYNFEELRGTLEAAGHRFRSGTDTEVVLHAYEEWGEGCVQRFVGMFAFAVWNDRARTLFAARDRIGIKPFYYQHLSSGIRFASELKALVALPAGQRQVDQAALWQYLARGYVCPPRTIYAGTNSLPPAHHLRWSAASGALQVERYWDPVDAHRLGAAAHRNKPRNMDEVVEELDGLLKTAVKLRLRSDVPLGAFLSGGLDSTLVVSLMAAMAGSTVKTFTIGFEERQYDEAPAARRIAAHFGTEHRDLVAREQDALDIIPRLVDYYDEPFADSSAIPTCLVSLLAHQHVTVALSGDGGDELFGGYQHYRTIDARLKYARAVPDFARGYLSRVGEALPDSRLQTALASLRTANGPEGFFDYFTSIWRPYELQRLAPGLIPAPLAGASRVNGTATDLETFMLSDLQRYLPHDILTKVDRASMAASLEARVPLLDHRVVEFVVGLPEGIRIQGATHKVLLKRLLARYIPAAIIDRPKSGFAVPLSDWLRGPLKWMLDDYLSTARVRQGGVFDPRVVRRVVDRFLRGQIGHARPWALLVYQMWSDKYQIA
jgi:asparagine synthase (glutamine-hydrolysing)